LPDEANFAAAPSGVAFDAWPPVFEKTSVSMTRMLTSPVGEHVIEAAVADVVGPAVAADQPDAF
jgi:hypothetical protein